jgi:IclR family transcriptional regulator, KDG regulon repressor
VNQSLQKAAQILDIMMQGPTPVALTEFSRALGMPISTVSRFLSTMESLGFVRRESESGKFYLGLKLFELGCRAVDDVGLRRIALPQMEKLRDRINENVFLTVLEGTKITYLDKIESLQAIVTQANIGGTAPAYCVSSGKVLLSYDDARLEQTIAEGLKTFTPLTITDPEKLRQECKRIRKLGYAMNKGEFRTGVTGIAAPIFNSSGAPVAAISSATPIARMNKQRWQEHVTAVVQSAAIISRELGHIIREHSYA